MNADVHTLIGAYALDAIDGAERELVDDHLRECEACADEAAELREAVWRLSDATIAEPPPGLRDRVLHSARRTRQEAPVASAPPTGAAAAAQRRRAPLVRRALALAAAVVMIAFAGGVVTWAAMRAMAPDTTGDDRIAAVLEAGDARVTAQDAEGGGRVVVVASESLDQAVVMVSELAEVPDDRAYQVWMVDQGGPTSAGVMDPGDSSATMLVAGLGDTELIGVTNEPAGGSQDPTLPMVADVALST